MTLLQTEKVNMHGHAPVLERLGEILGIYVVVVEKADENGQIVVTIW